MILNRPETLTAILARVSHIKRNLRQISRHSQASFQRTLATQQEAEPKKIDTRLEKVIHEASLKNNLDPALTKAVIHAESAFNSRAVSRVGAQGLMQLMPSTSRALGISNAFDPEQNLDAGCRYLRQMLDRHNGDTTLALAAYNAGPNAVKKYSGVPPYSETQNYIKRVLMLQKCYR